ncbi:MAG: response regulator [Flavobacterium sp.]
MDKKVHTVLLVDDDLAINYFHKRLLSKSDLSDVIITLYNGEVAIQALIENNLTLTENDKLLVFLDLNMPIMNGWQFLDEYEKIKKSLKFECKIFVLSSSINPDDIKKAESNAFVSRYLAKPLSMDNVNYIKEYL